jgi:hypothetical protein
MNFVMFLINYSSILLILAYFFLSPFLKYDRVILANLETLFGIYFMEPNTLLFRLGTGLLMLSLTMFWYVSTIFFHLIKFHILSFVYFNCKFGFMGVWGVARSESKSDWKWAESELKVNWRRAESPVESALKARVWRCAHARVSLSCTAGSYENKHCQTLRQKHYQR